MTLSEFKAWFEGYTEGLEAAPTKAQFDRIKEKVKEISGTPVSYPVYIDRYVEPYRRYWGQYWGATGVGYATSNSVATYAANAAFAPKGDSVTETFDSHAAMYALGKAEAKLN